VATRCKWGTPCGASRCAFCSFCGLALPQREGGVFVAPAPRAKRGAFAHMLCGSRAPHGSP
jgi:hypothetical protein